jgi:dephospho-CoA kinase
MIVIGLTGSIGMGKTTTAKLFSGEGVPVWDADAAVHRLYAPGGRAVKPILEAFPNAGNEETGIDRSSLSAALQQAAELRRLESIVHPLVREDQAAFLDLQRRKNAPVVVLDIPLLAESGAAAAFDAVVVVTADENVRRARVLSRPGMTEDKFEAILSRQAPEAERLAIADHVIRTDRGIPHAREEVRAVLSALREKHGLPKSPSKGSDEA